MRAFFENFEKKTLPKKFTKKSKLTDLQNFFFKPHLRVKIHSMTPISSQSVPIWIFGEFFQKKTSFFWRFLTFTQKLDVIFFWIFDMFILKGVLTYCENFMQFSPLVRQKPLVARSHRNICRTSGSRLLRILYCLSLRRQLRCRLR